MANERDSEQNQNETGQQGQQQPPIAQQGDQQGEQGQPSNPAAQPATGAQTDQQRDPQNQGQRSSGQASTDQSGDTATLTGGQSDNPDSTGSAGAEQRGGFVGSQPSGSDDYLREGATSGSDFAAEGQGALDPQANTTDVETGQSTNANRDDSGGDAE